MAAEDLKRDQNFITVLGAVTDDSNQYITMLRVDPTTKRLLVSATGIGGGSVTSISGSTGILLTPDPITTTGSVALATSLQPIATFTGNAGKFLRVNAGETAVEYATAATGTVTSVSVVTANGVSGSVATSTTTPAITLTLGAITPTSVNGLTITSSTGTLTIANGKTLTVSNSGTLAGGDAFVLAIAAGKTFTASSSITLAGTDGKTLTVSNSGTLAGGDAFVLAIAAGKTLTVSNSITLTGTDSTVMTFPSTSATIARTDAGQTFTGVSNATSWNFTTPVLGTPTSGTLTNCTGLPAASVVAGTLGTGAYTMDTRLTVPQIINTNNAITASGNAATVPITSRISTVTNNSAATLTITITTTSAVEGQTVIVRILDASAATQTITWVNTENSTVTAPTTSNGSTTLPLTVGFMYNSATSKWRCVASA